jgi:hypothetical protein
MPSFTARPRDRNTDLSRFFARTTSLTAKPYPRTALRSAPRCKGAPQLRRGPGPPHPRGRHAHTRAPHGGARDQADLALICAERERAHSLKHIPRRSLQQCAGGYIRPCGWPRPGSLAGKRVSASSAPTRSCVQPASWGHSSSALNGAPPAYRSTPCSPPFSRGRRDLTTASP